MRRVAFYRAGLIVASFLLLFWPNESRSTTWAVPPTDKTRRPREAASLFKSKCATCHGKDGRAKTFKAKFNGARNLTEASWQASVTDERIFNSISNGRGKKMPAFGEKLSQAEIESLVALVRGLKK